MVRSVSRVKDKDASVVNENANKDSERFNVERDLTAGSVAKTFGLKILPKKLQMHISKVIFIFMT